MAASRRHLVNAERPPHGNVDERASRQETLTGVKPSRNATARRGKGEKPATGRGAAPLLRRWTPVREGERPAQRER